MDDAKFSESHDERLLVTNFSLIKRSYGEVGLGKTVSSLCNVKAFIISLKESQLVVKCTSKLCDLSQ
jgi:hypothetical protein